MRASPESGRSLRQIFTLTVIAVGSLAVVSAGTLIATTSWLQRATASVAAAVESVRLVQEAEISLLLHARADDPVIAREFESEIRAALEQLERHVTSAAERSVLDNAHSRVESYLDAWRPPHDARTPVTEASAFAALEQLVDINLEQAHAAHRVALEWNRIANLIGVVLGAAIVGVTIGLVLWLRRRVIRPWLAFADTVRRFGEGERAVRAVERGPLEIREVSRRFNEMAESIATQRRAQIAFLGGIAHDLRTPLSSMALAVDMLAPDEPLPPEPKLRRTLAVIARQLHHLHRMTDDFVDMSTIEAGTLRLDVERHDVRTIVRDAAGVLSQSSAVADRLRISLPPDPCVASCDHVRIGQAVTNLVSNAIKYSPASEPVEVRVKSDPSDVIIEVIDRGAGIAPGDQSRMFEPFRRIGATTIKGVTGTGLGLFNVQRIVEGHGGRVEVDSAPSRGSSFRIYLPVAGA